MVVVLSHPPFDLTCLRISSTTLRCNTGFLSLFLGFSIFITFRLDVGIPRSVCENKISVLGIYVCEVNQKISIN